MITTPGGISLVANVICAVRHVATGRVLFISRGHNLVVNTGRQLVRDLLGGTGLRPNLLAIGTGTATPAAGDTALGTEVLNKAIDRRIQTTYGIEFQTLIETGEGNGNEISEIGTFEESIMLARALIVPTITKTAAIEITVSHIVTVNAP